MVNDAAAHAAIYALIETRANIETLKQREAQLSAQLAEFYSASIKDQIDGKEYGCGTATIAIPDGKKIKFEIGKTVKYDQDGLERLHNQIKNSGRNPAEYIKTKYDVSEAAYKAWPSDIKAAFEPFRTVTPSKPRITIVEKE